MAANSHSLDLEAGSSQYASAADSASLSITGNLSISFWVKFETTPSSGNTMDLVSKYDDQTADDRSWRFFLFNEGGTLKLQLNISNNGTAQESLAVAWTPSTATWYYIVLTFTAAASEARFYIDNAQQGTTQTGTFTAISDEPSSLFIGAINPTPSSFLDGLIDEIVITSDVLSAQERQDLFDGWDATEKVDNMAAYYKLNNGYLDETANNNDLTASGSPVFSTDVPFANYATDEVEDLGGVFLLS